MPTFVSNDPKTSRNQSSWETVERPKAETEGTVEVGVGEVDELGRNPRVEEGSSLIDHS